MSLVDFILEYMTRTEMRLDDYYWEEALEVIGIVTFLVYL
jgi:hypothetical protein